MLDTKGQWTSEFPTKEDAGKWFIIRRGTRNKRVNFTEIRYDKESGVLFLADESNLGITKTSYGHPLNLWKNKPIQFFGPIQMPPNYREIEKQEEILYGAIFQHKIETELFVELTSESDGEGGSFGLEYWQVKPTKPTGKGWDYIGSSPFTMNRGEIEDNSDWKRIK